MTELIQALNAHAPNILRTFGLMEIQIALLALLVLASERVSRQPLPKIRFNPFVWLMNLRLSRYREEICDDFALQHAAVPPRQYGEILLRFLETNAAEPATVRAGTCFFETTKGLKQRLNYLLMPKEAAMNRFNWKHKLLVAGLLIMLPMGSWQCNHRPDSPVAPAASEGKIISPSNFVQLNWFNPAAVIVLPDDDC